MSDLKTEVVLRPTVSPAYFAAELGRVIANYARAHAEVFDTKEYRTWLAQYRKRKEAASCPSGTTSQDTPS